MDQSQSPTLSILIATIKDRAKEFSELSKEFERQADGLPIEILSICDNREMSIGVKRRTLLWQAKGKWIVFFDDDDWPASNYVELILRAIESDPSADCIGINVSMTTNGLNPQRCCHSLYYREWADNVDGWDYVRNITHFNPVLREKALQIGFPDLRFGEDKDYSDKVTAILSHEVYIDPPLFHYRYSTKVPHKKKYGIK